MAAIKFFSSWYVLHTRSRFESVVHEGLAKKSLEVFLPKITVKSRRRDRKVMIKTPLFPGYIFVKTDLNPHEHLEIIKTVGAVRLIGNRDRPIPVHLETIESLKIMVAGDNPVSTGTKLKKGKKVIVINGPFTGLTGILSRHKGKGRIIVNIEAMGRFAAVEVDIENIEPLPDILS